MSSIFISLVRKEARHIIRDRRTMLISLLMPLVLLILFGFAISTEVNNIRVVAVVDRPTDATRDLLMRLQVNPYFSFLGLASSADVDRLLRTSRADAALFVRDSDGRLDYQIVVDASNSSSAQAMTGYLTALITEGTPSAAVTRTLYNPQMRSAYNFVPGIMGMIFILICAMMTSVSIVREKENGTMDLLLVSPVRPYTIILGKLVPYLILSCLILAVMLLVAYDVLGLPLSATLFSVVGVSLLYIVMSLSIGLLVSTIVSTQLNALIVSAVAFMLPVIMLSGMIFPIDNMPTLLQWISCVIPARWYTEAMRRLMIQQLDLSYVAGDIAILASITLVILGLAIVKFRNSTKS